MEQQYILTPTEADIISTIRNDDEATIYEITTATQLTPSEAFDVLSRLRDRNLVRLTQDNRLAKLTDEGHHVRMLLERQERQPFPSSSSAAQVVIRGESETGESRKAFEQLEPEALDLPPSQASQPHFLPFSIWIELFTFPQKFKVRLRSERGGGASC